MFRSTLTLVLVCLTPLDYDMALLTRVAEWVSGDVSVNATWEFGLTSDVVYHRLSRRDQQVFAEVKDRAEWGNFVSRLLFLNSGSADSITVLRH